MNEDLKDFGYAKSWLNFILASIDQNIPENIIDEYVHEWMISPSGFDGEYAKIGPFEILMDFAEYADLLDITVQENQFVEELYFWCNKIMRETPDDHAPTWKLEDNKMEVEYVLDREWGSVL